MKSLGNNIVAEYFNCDPELLNDVVAIEEAMVNAARKAEATIINSTFHHFSPFGVSGVIVIQESHLAIHTWPEYGFASVDIFTCGDSVDPWIAYKYLKDSLKAEYGSAMQMNRGPEDLLPKTDFDLQKFRDEKQLDSKEIKSTRDIWFTERNENLALSIKHKGRKLYDKISPYQKIEVYDTFAYGKALVLDGNVMCAEEDEYVYHEMITHVAILTHANPKNILVVGGGDGGTVRELLKHPEIEKITIVEIDAEVVKASEKFLPDLSRSFADSRAVLKIEDGISYIKNVQNEVYDIIIIDSNDPVGPSKGLFSEDFYKDVYRALKTNGIMITQSESPRFNQSVFTELYRCYKSIFSPENVYCFLAYIPTFPTGMWSFSYCTKNNRTCPKSDFDKERMENLMNTHNLKYYNKEIHSSAFALPGFVRSMLK